MKYVQAEDLKRGDVFRWFNELHLVLTRPEANTNTIVSFETLLLSDGSVRDWSTQWDNELMLEGA